MKVRNLILGLVLTTTVACAESKSGEELFKNHCSSCHTNIVGIDEQNGETTYITDDAPYIKDIVTKLKDKIQNKDEFILFIQDYINNPNKRKSLYSKGAIKKFGLMPSLNGVMSESESERLAIYLYSDYGKIVSKTKRIKLKKVSVGEKLFNKFCASCHTTVVGVKVSGCGHGEIEFITENAPYIKSILIKLKTKLKTKTEFTQFIKDYINHPEMRKSLYGKKAVKKFGLMPSLKGVMSDRKSTKLANYLYRYEID